ncbi:T9SS type A sorting domain-containing protein [Winogradskyella ouciana]|uniref:T9SS type A sorting domain-containing protein n=1 Tax=Winogradskyella ouciana TaxID=2608631 RepID=A0A7K1GAJ1_9FLAO|nr:T9SS type A sorting domain-containing protein [Winogradskyella ouciana]MTE26326.1 T9SS type A sorting domain-containing protein [Winogradskyella ouciana]
MRQLYTFFLALLLTLCGYAQQYDFGIVHNGGYNFSVVATPDFDATDTDVSDIGFTLMLPAGDADVTNLTQFNGRAWSATQVTEAQFTGAGVSSDGRDGFLMNLPPGQTILSHTNGTPFVVVNFEISNMPSSGQLEILLNSDPIAIALGGALDSFYNSNIDSTSTQDYFGEISPGQGSFNFSTLGIDDVVEEDLSVSVYPNPASEFISVEASFHIDSVELFDITGKHVLWSTQTNAIEVRHLPNGVYLLKIFSDKGSLTKKLVIK